MAAIAGLAMLVGAFALLRGFRVRQGAAAKHSEWIEISVAIVVTTAIGGGAMLVVAGVFGFLSSKF